MTTELVGTFECPICSYNEPHRHTESAIQSYLETDSSKFTPKIEIDVSFLTGYGSNRPEEWYINVIWENVLLEKTGRIWSERDVGRQELLFEQKWRREYDKAEWAAVVKDKPQASPICCSCLRPCRLVSNSTVHCIEKTWCRECADGEPLRLAKITYEEERRLHEERFTAKLAAEKAERDRRYY